MIQKLKKTYFRGRDLFISLHEKIKRKKLGYPITLYPETEKVLGRALYSYLMEPFYYLKNDSRSNGHTNRWETPAIAHALKDSGYIVDVIDFRDYSFVPTKEYDLTFDMYLQIPRISPYLSKKTKKILHLTRSYDPFNNQAEMDRVRDLKRRHPNSTYKPRRQLEDLNKSIEAIELADYCLLMGNEVTLSTYPEKYHNKISLINATGSPIRHIKKEHEYVPEKREFVWFFGCGAVHKGLDRLIEIFARHPELTLNIIGSVDAGEEGLFDTYKKELRESKNIRVHGYFQPISKKFERVIKNCFCFIAPSASEGMSPACITCMQAGLFPIMSKNCGISLPDNHADNHGIILKDCSIEEIEKTILHVHKMGQKKLIKQIRNSQKQALEEFSRENFIKNIKNFFETKPF